MFIPKRINVTVSDFPSVEPIRVFAIDAIVNKEKHWKNKETEKVVVFHCSWTLFFYNAHKHNDINDIYII